MSKPDYMKTYEQFLAANRLSDILLMKHAQESSGGPFVLYGDIQVEEALMQLVERLGYRVERVTAQAPAPVLEAAE